jgi:hypothetical protein
VGAHLAAIHGQAQPVLHVHALHRALVHGGKIELVVVAAGGFRTVHSHVGVADHRLYLVAI